MAQNPQEHPLHLVHSPLLSVSLFSQPIRGLPPRSPLPVLPPAASSGLLASLDAHEIKGHLWVLAASRHAVSCSYTAAPT